MFLPVLIAMAERFFEILPTIGFYLLVAIFSFIGGRILSPMLFCEFELNSRDKTPRATTKYVNIQMAEIVHDPPLLRLRLSSSPPKYIFVKLVDEKGNALNSSSIK